MLYLIGLGLGDAKDISVKGLEAVRACESVYLEAYTSILCHGPGKEELEAFYGRPVLLADRDVVESGCEEMLAKAKMAAVALLVVGDPFGATTHSDLVIRAKERGIAVKVIHNASILNAVGVTGLQLYRFGETVSLVLWTETWQPDSYYDKIAGNRSRGFHTLCLLDIKVKEQSEANLVRGRAIFEPPRYMTAAEAASQLLTIAERRGADGGDVAFGPDSTVVAVARVGWEDQRILACSLIEMSTSDLGPPLHSLIIPGELHEMETRMLQFYGPDQNKE